MKKILASILAMSMVASMGITAFATATYDTDLSIDLEPTEVFDSDGYKLGSDTVKPDKKLYIRVDINELDADMNRLGDIIDEGKLMKVKLSKGDENAKMISSVKLVEKVLGGWSRQYYIEVVLNDDMTDTEYKIAPVFKLTAKKDLINDNGRLREANAGEVASTSSDSFTIASGVDVEYTVNLWISNTKNTGDQDYLNGTGGVYLKPDKNDENEVLWSDENRDFALLAMEVDSVAKYIYPKLSTKWDNSQYAEMFADQDAFRLDFVGNPELPSTSRAVLDLYVPYLDEDGDLTVDEENIIVYEETEDGLVDITAKGEFGVNDNDETIFRMKTRQLGTYIFAEAEATVAGDEVVDEPVTDDIKTNPGTGF